MPRTTDLTDDKGHVLCRYCRFSSWGMESRSCLCNIGDNPGPVDLDIAECFEGELAPDSEWWERERWGS
jgi:hypothetical protein